MQNIEIENLDEKLSSFTNNKALEWIFEIINMCRPRDCLVINGSKEQLDEVRRIAINHGELEELDQQKMPNCYLHRTKKDDVARVEDRTFVCTSSSSYAGPTNNWMSPVDAYSKLRKIFDSSMQGRTMYVIPFLMGTPGSTFAKVGVEITDSMYVVLNMAIMTRTGKNALDLINDGSDFTRCVHSKKDLNPLEKYIMHFPEDNTIWSVNSAYGGNVLLGKKSLSLRLGSCMGKEEGWLAEHMLIMEIEDLEREKKYYIAAAFPSACGKTNLAMLNAPESLRHRYVVRTIGDDIAWIHPNNGSFYASNPENGFFGVAPGTSSKTNPNAMKMLTKDTIFTNVLKTNDNTAWWEGCENSPSGGVNWEGLSWEPNKGMLAAHPNARFTSPLENCPVLSNEWDNINGVRLSAIIFGGRRHDTMPLVLESFSWHHGVFLGSIMSSERTAASEGHVGDLVNDPMAMKAFCGYDMAEYFRHWLNFGTMSNLPKIFTVNWFRQRNGKFLWPGFSDNLRVLEWILQRCENSIECNETFLGYVPKIEDLNTEGLEIEDETLNCVINVNNDEWKTEVLRINKFFEIFGKSFPSELRSEVKKLQNVLK